MKTFLKLFLLVGVVSGKAVLAHDGAPTPTEFTYTLESRQTNRYAEKCGFEYSPETCCPEVRKFFGQYQYDRTVSVTRHWGDCDPENAWWSGSFTENVTQMYSKSYCTSYCASASGSITADYYTATRDCDGWNLVSGGYTNSVGDMFGCYAADQFGLYFAVDADCDQLWFYPLLTNATCSSGSYQDVFDCRLFNWDEPVKGSYVHNFTYSDPFTTADLIAMVQCDPAGEWIPVGGKSYVASASIAADESSATVNAAEARFKVWAPKDEEFVIPYVEYRTVFTNGESVVIGNEKEAKGKGTGDWQIILVALPAAFSTYEDGDCTRYRGEEAWIEVRGGCPNNSACSAGSCGITPSTTQAQNNSVHITMGLGATSYGAGQAALKIVGERPHPNLTSPAGLEVFGDLRGAAIVKSGGQIQQVKSLYVLANVVVHSPTNYTVEFYDGASFWGTGPFDPTGYTPISTNNIQQVGSTNHIRLTISNGMVYDYYWSDADQGWTLASGSGFRKEVRTFSDSPRVRTHTIKDAADAVIYQEIKRYVALGTNYFLAQREIGGAGGLTNKWFYYDNAGTDGTNYGKVRLTIEPGGFWRRYQYDQHQRLTNEVSQFLNAATNAAESLCRVVRYDYTSLDGTNDFETQIELLQGVEIAREYTVEFPGETRHIRCVTPGAAWTNAANLVTVTRLYGSGEFAGKTHKVISPDGAMQLYEYTRSSGQETVTVYAGQPNSGFTTVIKGTKTETVTYENGQKYSEYTYDIELSSLAYSGEVNTYDSLGRLQYRYPIDGTTISHNYDCCGLESIVSADGITTTYLHDVLHRQKGTLVNDITTTNLLDAAGNVLKTVRVGTDNYAQILRQASYDTAGRLLRETNALSGVTVHTNWFDGSGQLVRTTTFPDNGQRVETYYQDGSLKSVTGSAVFPLYYEYGAYNNGSFTKEIKGSASGTEWVKTYTDLAGRSWKTEYPDGAASTNFFNLKGQLEKAVDPDGVTRLQTYNGLGQTDLTILDLNRNGVGTDSVDRITRSTNDVVEYAGNAAPRSRVYQTVDNGAEVLVSERLSIPALNTSISLSFGLGTTNLTQYYPASGQRLVTTTQPDGSQTITLYTNGLLAQVKRIPSGGWPIISQIDYAHDAHGRQYQAIDLRNGATTYAYNDADQVQTVTTPSPDGVAGGLVTTTYYDKSLRATNVIHPDSTSTKSVYFANGLLQKTWGSRIYPVEYLYDYAGRMTNMLTWQNFNESSGAGTSGSAATKWRFDGARGWLTNKLYADNTGPGYTYTPAGRLRSRAWARGVTTWYTNNNAGELAVVNYSDTTPDVTNSYDRRGRMTNVLSGATSLTKLLDDAGNLLQESYTGGPLNGVIVTNHYDDLLRRDSSGLRVAAALRFNHGYSYTTASQLETVSDGVNSATYTRLANSALVGEITFATNSVTVMTTTKGYDFVNRLTNTTTVDVGLGALDSHDYKYNPASQRTSVTNVDGSYWVYGYDTMGQVTSGKKYWSDNTPVAGQQFDYAFDDIGNRQTTTRDGRQATYSPNTLNQYTSRTVPGFVNVLGTATNTATVSLWSKDSTALFTPTTRKGDYFRGEMPFNNATGAMWLTITNVAAISNYSGADIVTNIVGSELLAKNLEAFTYDLDGNLTSDSLWTNAWNGENRRITIESRSRLSAAAKVKEEWTILADGRWIERIVSTNNGTAYYPSLTNRYVWDNQVLLAVLDHTNGVVLSFLRGLDLSGSIQGAGGVGGVLAVNAGPSAQSGNMTNTSHFACYDGNGNVTALINSATGLESARYERGPFVEKIRETGPMAKLNPIRFSTQYTDDVTGDAKYLYRDYQADTGRWLSRDPVGETASKGLYVFCQNDFLNKVDKLGLLVIEPIGEIFDLESLGEPGLAAQMNPSHSRPFKVKSCGWDKKKIADYSMTIKRTIYYKKGIDPSAPTPGNADRTIRQHELIHGQHYVGYLSKVDEFFTFMNNRCVCNPCFDAALRYAGSMESYLERRAAYEDASLDCSDYPPGSTAKATACAAAQSIAAELPNLAKAMMEDNSSMKKVCNWR